MFQISCFLIKLFWRSHLQYPSVYKNETSKIFSKTMPHNLKNTLTESPEYLEKLWKNVLLSLALVNRDYI